MSLKAVSRALAEALMVRYAIFNYGADGTEFLPEWPASAIGTEVYFRLRPAQSENLVQWIDFEEPGSLAELLERGWDEPVSDANGYALLLSMRRSGVTPSELRALFARASAGFDISEALETLIQPELPTDEPVTLEAWWQASLDAITESADGVLESMEVSREWIALLSDLSTIAESDLNFRTIWAQRDVEEVRAMIEARYELVRLRLIWVNPAYYNAAVSLGSLFESLLNDDRQFEYLHSLTAFLSDFEDTKQLQAAVEEKLSSMPQ